MSNTIIVTDTDTIEQLINKAVAISFEKSRPKEVQLLTINQVAKTLHLSHGKVKKLVEEGIIKTTSSGHIEKSELDLFLKNK